jgi:hypothetical protein
MRKVARENREGGGNGGAMKMDFEPLLRAAGITRFRIIKDNGHWVEMRK